MNKQELIEKLKELHSSVDYEIAHIEADNLLIEYINDEDIMKAFEQVPRWYA